MTCSRGSDPCINATSNSGGARDARRLRKERNRAFHWNSIGVGGFSGVPCNHGTRRDRDGDRGPCPRNIPRHAHDDKGSRSSRTASAPKKERSGKPARFFSYIRSLCSVLSSEELDPVPPPSIKRGRGCVYSISIPGNPGPDRVRARQVFDRRRPRSWPDRGAGHESVMGFHRRQSLVELCFRHQSPRQEVRPEVEDDLVQ